jgi:hypothetical protein
MKKIEAKAAEVCKSKFPFQVYIKHYTSKDTVLFIIIIIIMAETGPQQRTGIGNVRG